MAAELARGVGPGRVTQVERLGTIEDDPNVTDKRFPGNPTRCNRTTEPLRIIEQRTGWDPPTGPRPKRCAFSAALRPTRPRGLTPAAPRSRAWSSCGMAS
jgi:hypothetical protein